MSRLAFACAFLAGPLVAAEDPVVAAARARQGSVRSLVNEFRQVSRAFLPANAIRPATEASVTADNRVVLDGPRVRVEDNNPAIAMGGGFARHEQVTAFDGEICRTLFPHGIGPNEPPTGIIHAKMKYAEAAPPVPIVLYARGLDPMFGHTIDEWLPTARSADIDGATCQEFRFQEGQSVRRYWADPARGYVVSRSESGRAEEVSHRVTITYRKDSVVGWVPAGWRSEDLNADGSPKYVQEVTVTRLTVNVPVAANEFRIEFPAGANVNDQAAHKDFKVGADGQLRELSAEEMFGPRPRPTLREWAARNAWGIVLAGAALALALGGILIWKQVRRPTVPVEQADG